MATVLDGEADLIVVGYGAAGSVAALTAARLGASVLLLEKQSPRQHTPSARMSGGLVMGVNDIEQATTYFERCAGPMIPTGISRVWATRARGIVDWLGGLGLRLQRVAGGWHPHFDGVLGVDVYAPLRPDAGLLDDGLDLQTGVAAGTLPQEALKAYGSGNEFFAPFMQAVSAEPNIRVCWEHAARHLVRGQADGRVNGVQAETPYGSRTFGARYGVVLASGGYEFDETLKLNYLKAYPIHLYGNPGNTGDGIRMAQEVGADLWHMNQMVGRAVTHFALDEHTRFSFNIALSPPYVITDKHGRRLPTNTPRRSRNPTSITSCSRMTLNTTSTRVFRRSGSSTSAG